MSHVLHVTNVTCHKEQVAKIVTKDHICYIFLESCCKIHFNVNAKNITCHMCFNSHFTNVKCHIYQVAKNFAKYFMCYIFLERWCKIQFNPPQVTCVIYHMSHMSQDAMLKSHPSDVTHGTCYKYQLMSAEVYIESMYLFGLVWWQSRSSRSSRRKAFS